MNDLLGPLTSLISLTGDVDKAIQLLVLGVVLFQFTVFVLSLWVIYKLWMTIIDFLGERSTDRAELLASILGHAEVDASAKNTRFKVIGAGLGGTVVVLGIAVIAMYVLGNHTIGG